MKTKVVAAMFLILTFVGLLFSQQWPNEPGAPLANHCCDDKGHTGCCPAPTPKCLLFTPPASCPGGGTYASIDKLGVGRQYGTCENQSGRTCFEYPERSCCSRKGWSHANCAGSQTCWIWTFVAPGCDPNNTVYRRCVE
jgi:hypothetical protein